MDSRQIKNKKAPGKMKPAAPPDYKLKAAGERWRRKQRRMQEILRRSTVK